MQKNNVVMSVLLLLLSVACATQSVNPNITDQMRARAEAQDILDETMTAPGLLMVFSEREAGTKESYRTSIFINKDILFLADNRNQENFILMDRATKTINSLNRADKTIFVITEKPITIKPPIEIDYVEESQPSSAIPKVQGMSAQHYRYTANGKHCYDSVTIDASFMPDALEAMREFRQILAGEHASTLGAMPADMHDACDLALNIFYATKHIDHGLPLREWGQDGYQRFMLDFKVDFRMKKELVELPADYKRYSVTDMMPAAKEKSI